jgi:hypothetical protein
MRIEFELGSDEMLFLVVLLWSCAVIYGISKANGWL